MSFLPETKGQRMAVEYLNRHFIGSDKPLMVGGHSKGGNFAVYASAFCDSRIRNRIERVFSNDGPGFRKEVTKTQEYRQVLEKVESLLPENTLVGMLFSGKYKHRIVKSSAEGLMQHDATTWQVLGADFVEAETRSEDSYIMDATLRNWLGGLSDKDRIFFTDKLFDLLTKNGATTLEDLSEGGIGGLLDMLVNMHSLPKEEREEFGGILGNLLRSYWFSVSQSYMAQVQDEYT